jgi:hypothetical protein
LYSKMDFPLKKPRRNDWNSLWEMEGDWKEFAGAKGKKRIPIIIHHFSFFFLWRSPVPLTSPMLTILRETEKTTRQRQRQRQRHLSAPSQLRFGVRNPGNGRAVPQPKAINPFYKPLGHQRKN